ncbi:MAG: phage tail assembly chaperone [Halocynthiibacter sp.]
MAKAITGLDWGALLARGLGEAGLRPRDFWALTPLELMLVLGVDASTGPFGRADFESLVQAFPDTCPQEMAARAKNAAHRKDTA